MKSWFMLLWDKNMLSRSSFFVQCIFLLVNLLYIVVELVEMIMLLYADVEKIEQAIEWRGLDMEQSKHTMLGNRFHIWLYDGRAGLFLLIPCKCTWVLQSSRVNHKLAYDFVLFGILLQVSYSFNWHCYCLSLLCLKQINWLVSSIMSAVPRS